MQGQITISPSFFKKERLNYSNFSEAFWRELFQNSIDAGSSAVDIKITHEKGTSISFAPEFIQQGVLVQFSDNGSGMDEKTIKDVYFSLGETTKNDASSIGGFGKARILTSFSHHYYGMETQYARVRGCGSSYDLTTSDTFVNGCRVWADVDAAGRYENYDMTKALLEYLSLCHLRCRITSNVPEVNMYSNWVHRGKHVRDLSFGEVYVNKSSGKLGYLIVRVNGVAMFSRTIRPNVQVIVEIDPTKSREVLLSNRDSLSLNYQSELDRFVNELAVDTKSAISKRTRSTKVIGSLGCCTTVRPGASLKPLGNNPTVGSIVPTVYTQSSKNFFIVSSPDAAAGTSIKTNASISDAVLVEEKSKAFDPLIPSFAIKVDTECSVMKKAAWLFNPENMDGEYFGSRKRKLARLWYVAVDWAIQGYLETTGKNSVSWVPGFVFSDCEACIEDHDGLRRVLIRPVDTNGKIRYSINDRDDRVRMLVSAAHEVAHISYTYHDEDFANLKDSLFTYVMINERKIFNNMDAVIQF